MGFLIYLLSVIIVGFFAYKSRENQFKIEGYKKSKEYINGTYQMVFVKNSKDWIERPIFWKLLAVTLLWPFMLPFLAILKGLNFLYNKLNINNLKIFKKDEEFRKHFETKHGIVSRDEL